LLPARVEGEQEARWVLLDYLDVVLHVQVPEMRERYRLERLWGERGQLDLGLTSASS
jgi:ribosome-associated protein